MVIADLTGLCDRIDDLEPRVRAFVAEPDRRARLAATPAATGPVVAVKDVIHVDGLTTRAGSAVPPEAFRGAQASVVTRLLAAGALIAGKTVTAEFAGFAPGPTRNPHHPEHTPGGSSSGSAAAVAAGMVPLALGTQTLASVVRPAAYCGVVGFKPTFGRVPLDGVIPNAPSLDTIGWFTPTVADALAAASLLFFDSGTGGEARGLPILGVPSRAYLERATPAALDAFDGHLAALRTAGFEVRHPPLLDDFTALAEHIVVVNRYELARGHAAWFAEHAERYRPETAAAILDGQRIDPSTYVAALRWKRDFVARYADVTAAAGVDVWVAPSATSTAPAGLAGTGEPTMGFPFSFAGAPALSVPAGHDEHGLPWGLQCAGQRGGDERLLAFAAAIEPHLPG
jgi:Asp-tRNA(Asn)/Glu-tRNA(Gln) amidotransferase A subunit family amidase